MILAIPLVLALSGATPERALFLFELHGVPVGTVELGWDRAGRMYTYRSTHMLSRGDVRTRLTRGQSVTVNEEGRAVGGWPSALWIWREPAPGCADGFEELTGKRGRLCAEAKDASGALRGTMFGQAFRATYTEGRLQVLELPDARFVAVPRGTSAAWPPDLFEVGVPVEAGRGALALEPPRPVPEPPLRPAWKDAEARTLAKRVHDAFPEKRPGKADFTSDDEESGSCLAHARRFVLLARARGRDAAVVHGLLVEPGSTRAYPHVWVRMRRADGGTLEVDPTSLDAVTPATHLPLAVEGAGESPGAVWLQLFSGRLRVMRR